MNPEKKKLAVVLGLAMALPSTIMGISFFVSHLIDKEYISKELGLCLIILVIGNIFYLMVRNVLKKKKK